MIPELELSILKRYRDKHIPPGGFMMAILSQDYREAVRIAQNTEKQGVIIDVLKWLCHPENMPPEAWGSKDAVDQWLDHTEWKS